jgi:release factor glutamine methyltransferase
VHRKVYIKKIICAYMQENYPIEYIQGSVQFFGRDFVVTPDVLIPRLETEGLVRRAREIIRTKGIETVIDIGTGSGIIGVSCADLVDSVVFLDISEEALDIAKKNFQTHFPEKSAIFAVSDLLSGYQYQSEPPLIPPSQGGSETIPPSHYPANILFVANLPYIRENDWENMSADTRHEPELALFG